METWLPDTCYIPLSEPLLPVVPQNFTLTLFVSQLKFFHWYRSQILMCKSNYYIDLFLLKLFWQFSLVYLICVCSLQAKKKALEQCHKSQNYLRELMKRYIGTCSYKEYGKRRMFHKSLETQAGRWIGFACVLVGARTSQTYSRRNKGE